MLVQLLPEQISKHWETIKWSVRQSLPPTHTLAPDFDTTILTKLLCNKMQCWLSSGQEGKVRAIITTTIMTDEFTGTKSLMIYTLYGIGTLGDELWREGFEVLGTWGRSQGCCKISAYTNSKSVIEQTRRFGGNAEFTYITVPLV